jgi:hypothetical protein
VLTPGLRPAAPPRPAPKRAVIDDAADDRRPPRPDGRQTTHPETGRQAAVDPENTVEAEVRRTVAKQLGGPRGAVETVLPFAVFSLVFVVREDVRSSVIAGVGAAVAMMTVRLVQGSSTQFVRNGLFGIALGAVFATMSGRAETAFLPGIIQSAVWAAGLTVSIIVRWPAVGFLVGSVLGDPTSWRDDPAIVKLSNRLTLIMLLPMVLRVSVQYPLYLAGEVGWLGVSRVALGWPLSAVAFAVAAAILARGRTPLHRQPQPEG